MNILRLRGTRLLTVRREFTNTEMGRAEKNCEMLEANCRCQYELIFINTRRYRNSSKCVCVCIFTYSLASSTEKT